MSEEKLEFTRSFLIYGNLTLLAWMLLAFLGTWLYNQIYGYLLLVFTAVAIYLILRRLGCSSCYYCKSCTSGFGRLAGAFFGTGYLKKGSVGNRTGLVGFIYFLLFPLPTVFLVLSMLQAVSVFNALVLTLLVLIFIYSLLTWRKTNPNSKTAINPVP